jgi:hypothetical protein
MRYQKVEWHHESPDYPVLLFAEIDDSGMETRKVDVYSDGRWDYADATQSVGKTRLSIEPMTGIEEIAAQAEFSPVEISNGEFERAWSRALRGTRRPSC